MQPDLSFQITELSRRLSNIIRKGKVSSVDVATATCRVQIGPIITTGLPWLTPRAGSDRTWWAPSVDEQVMILSPSGELAQGVILPAIYSDANEAPTNDENKVHITFSDEGIMEYDTAAHHLNINLPDGATAEIKATGGIKLIGDTEITGELTVTENIKAAKEVEDKTSTMDAMRDVYNDHTKHATGDLKPVEKME